MVSSSTCIAAALDGSKSSEMNDIFLDGKDEIFPPQDFHSNSIAPDYDLYHMIKKRISNHAVSTGDMIKVAVTDINCKCAYNSGTS